MFKVYVLHSPSFRKIYVGYTSDLNQRTLSHNVLGKKGYTVRFRPWILIYLEEYETKSEAMKREQELKSARGRKFIWALIESATKGLTIGFISASWRQFKSDVRYNFRLSRSKNRVVQLSLGYKFLMNIPKA